MEEAGESLRGLGWRGSLRHEGGVSHRETCTGMRLDQYHYLILLATNRGGEANPNFVVESIVPLNSELPLLLSGLPRHFFFPTLNSIAALIPFRKS